MTPEQYKIHVTYLAVALMEVGPLQGGLAWRDGWQRGLPLNRWDYVHGAKEMFQAAGIEEPIEICGKRGPLDLQGVCVKGDGHDGDHQLGDPSAATGPTRRAAES